MKPMILVKGLGFSFVLTVLGITSVYSQERKSVADMLEWSRMQVAAAEQELNESREKILGAKVPLIQRLDELKAISAKLETSREVAKLASDAEQAIIENLDELLAENEGDGRVLLNLLLQFRREFETSLSLSDRERYLEDFLAVEPANDADGRYLMASEAWDLVELGMNHVDQRIGGTASNGSVLINGVEETGRVIAIGPYSFFGNEEMNVYGIIEEGDDLQERLVMIGSVSAEEFATIESGEFGLLPIDPTVDQAMQLEAAKVPLIQHLKNGGYWMVPILGFGLISYAFAVWKLFELLGQKRVRSEEMDALLDKLDKSNEAAENTKLLEPLPSRMRCIFEAGLQYASRSIETREAAMRKPYLEFRHKLESKLSLIALVAAVAPLLGLLGTVTGMIKTFQLISIYGTGDAKSLSSGISEALVTTEFGLVVAIPALIAHAVLYRYVKRQISVTSASIDKFNHSLED